MLGKDLLKNELRKDLLENVLGKGQESGHLLSKVSEKVTR